MKKFFKRKQKKEIQDPSLYINKKKDHHFMFLTHWSEKTKNVKLRRGLKIASLVVLPLCAIALGTTIGVVVSNEQKQKTSLVDEIVFTDNYIKRRVYLISEDDYTIPLTVTLDKKNNVHEEMLDVINLLKVSSRASNEYLRGFIPDDTKVNSLTINDGNLTIDFSEDFLSYNEKNESKMIEALTASMLQFEDVDSLTISVEKQIIDCLPNNKTPINGSEVHLNNIITKSSVLENKELVTVFYQRNYSPSNQYLVPISLYANKGESDNITFVNGLFISLPSYRQLTNLDIYQEISKSQSKRNDFTLTVNQAALVDESTVNKELYDMVMLSLDLMNKQTKVSFDIEGEILSVDGIFQDEEQAVSSIYYNETKI